MKKKSKKILKWIKQNPMSICVIILSILVILVGRKFIGTKKVVLGVGILDIIYFLPEIYRLVTHTKKKILTKRQKKRKRKRIATIIFALIIMLMLAVFVFFFMIVKNAPDFDPDKLYKKESSILYDKNGNIFAKLGSEQRENITYEEMPEVLIDALIATEDSRFFQHNGFDLPRFAVASVKQLLGMSGAGGASTLTMQLNKNNYTSTQSHGWDGIIRKFTDIYMAIFKIERQYTKKEILEFYLNSNYLGSGAYGVEQASITYFGKSAKDLNLSEAAMIVGLFNAPDYLDPNRNPERAESRRLVVLSLMERHGYITSEEREIAKKMTVDKILVSKQENAVNAHQSYINLVISEIVEKTKNDPYQVPMEIYTMMDPDKQQYMDDIFAGNSDYVWENEVVQAGSVALDVNTGAIVAVASGRNVAVRGYSFATDIERQIGSTAKPLYDYGPGIEYQNWSTYTPFTDEPHSYGDGTKIVNWNRTYEGFRTMREALRVSRNIPALKAFQANNNADIKKFVTSLGLSPEEDSNGKIHEAHALGGYNGESPLSMAGAYAAFGNGGYYNKPYSVSKIVYRETNEVWEYKGKKTRVMSEETAYMVANMLIDSGQYGLASWRNINGAQYGAKSGTSNYSEETKTKHNLPSNAVNDLWVCGTNAQYAIALWYGYEDANQGYSNTTYTTKQRQLYSAIAKGFYRNDVTFTKPEGVIEVEIEVDSYPAKLPSANTPSDKRIVELFKKGTEPTDVSKRFSAPEAPTSLSANYKNGKITLSWTGSPTPWGLNQANAEAIGNELFGDAGVRSSFVNSYMSYNRSVLGNLTYHIYKKENGSLSLVGSTSETSYEYNVSAAVGSLTFVVKAGYTISGLESSGAEFTYKFDGSESIITSDLIGNATMTLSIGDTFKDPYIRVTDNLMDVTTKATITSTIIRESDGKEVKEISTASAESYTITYRVKYKNYTDSHIRTVIVKE